MTSRKTRLRELATRLTNGEMVSCQPVIWPMLREVGSRSRLLLLAATIVALVGCGGSYTSPFVSCSTPDRHFDLTGRRHGNPSLLGVVRRKGGSVVYAEGASGAVFASRTRGSTWTRVGRGVEGVPCALFALDLRRPRIMFAGNGDEIARSSDAGAHWTSIKLPHSSRASSVLILPTDDRLVYAWGFGGGHGGLTPGPPPGGVFRSDDAGLSWKKIASYEPDTVAVGPSAPRVLYVAAETGLYESSDGGAHWRAPTDGLPHPYANGTESYRLAVVAPTNAHVALVDADSERQMKRGPYWGEATRIVFRTTDGGRRWNPVLRLLYVADIAFTPNSSSETYVVGDQANSTYTGTTDSHLFRTVDSGAHWKAYPGRVPGRATITPTGRRYYNAAIATLYVDPYAENVLYGTTADGCLARSYDHGRSWSCLPALADARKARG
jgi:photosystem II stability/assembly factor-like uncharacterized protein